MKHPVYALITLTLALMIWSPTTSQAQDMGLSTAQAYEMSQNDETPVLFIDVRDLRENGFENARYVIHGFQGSATKDGKQKGLRIINGWQNSGLPWQAKPNPDKIYRMDSR